MILLISYSIKFLKMWNAKKNHGCINSLKYSSHILHGPRRKGMTGHWPSTDCVTQLPIANCVLTNQVINRGHAL